MNDTNVFEAFDFSRELILYVFRSLIRLLTSSGITRAIIYVFVIGIFISVLKILFSGNNNE